MTEQEKELLLKDLCARLPHKQKVCYKIHDNSEEITETLSGCLLDYFKIGKIAVVKPYLRLMSSMTEEEFTYIKQRWVFTEKCRDENDIMDVVNRGCIEICDAYSFVEWLNEHHFDYRGLIPMSLALPAIEGMYQH